MLIINADDLGANLTTTDTIADCFAVSAITSASAMVWMQDSARAAQIVRERGLSVGLHLNLTLPFNADGVPAQAAARQRSLTERFGPESWRTGATSAGDGALIRAAIEDQLQEFRALFGEPSHLDGHHHIHVIRAVLEQLPRELPIRPPLADADRGSFGQRWLLRRFRAPDVCLAFERLHPDLGGAGLEPLRQARSRTVEVMVHPARPLEAQALRSDAWLAAVGDLRLGSYLELGG